MMRRPELALAAALAAASVLVTVLVYGPVSGGALLGFDGYPLIAASALDAPGDLLGTFGQELMGGRYPDGRFYRPLVHLTFALDHALGGLDPAQYARTDLALAALTATLLGLLAAAMAGARGRRPHRRDQAGLDAREPGPFAKGARSQPDESGRKPSIHGLRGLTPPGAR